MELGLFKLRYFVTNGFALHFFLFNKQSQESAHLIQFLADFKSIVLKAEIFHTKGMLYRKSVSFSKKVLLWFRSCYTIIAITHIELLYQITQSPPFPPAHLSLAVMKLIISWF